MAVTTTPISSPIGAAIVTDTDCDNTAENDVRAGATTVYVVDIDNSLNVDATYVKLCNASSATPGTTAPDVILMCPASVRKVFPLDLSGLAFGTGLSFFGVTTPGTAGTTSPTSNVTVRILCT